MNRILTSKEACKELVSGNKRFVVNQSKHAKLYAQETRVIPQNPFAIVLGCSDSRVLVEALFDQGIGDLFVIRVAGNIIDDLVLASIEFAIDKFDISLILVLGHTHCGAITATIDAMNGDSDFGKHTQAIINQIAPLLTDNEKDVDKIVKRNIVNVIDTLNKELEDQAVESAGGIYALSSREVSFL